MPITFNDVCELLESVEEYSRKRPIPTPDVAKFRSQRIIASWFRRHRKALDDSATSGAAMLSILLPHRRKDRVYGLQPKSLARKLTKVLNLGHGRLALFAGWAQGTHGDLGVYFARALQSWDGTFRSKKSISLSEVDHLLVQMAASNRFSDPSTRRRRKMDFDADSELKNILVRLSSWEAKWLVRLLLRQYSTVELDEVFLFRQYHFLLPELLTFQNDFEAACDMLTGELESYPSVLEPQQERRLRAEAAHKLKPRVGTKVGRPTFYKAWSFKNCFQMVGTRAWAAEIKYDGEYCEIHVDLTKSPNDIQIFSKNGKDATSDRRALHDTIRAALRLGELDRPVRKNCILLGEMVVYSQKEQKILPFSKIRKHVSRSGSFLGNQQDSLPHAWENLMIVFFDVLMVDDLPILRQCLQERRKVLRDLIHIIPGKAMRAQWSLVDFKSPHGQTDLKQAFAWSLAHRQEGLVLKPLRTPYFSLSSGIEQQPGFFIKLKKDYLADMGGERDLGDFAIVGARFDPALASKSDVKPLHWTHFYLGCLVNRASVERLEAKPRFKVVGSIHLEQCIPKPDLKYLNMHGRLRELNLESDGHTKTFDFEHANGSGPQMTVAFKTPFVAEILGGGYEKVANETFEMLRHPRLKKIHGDRTWLDCVSLEDLRRLVDKKWDAIDPKQLDGHAKDVATLVRRYLNEVTDSQLSVSDATETEETDLQTTQRTTQETSQEGPRSHQSSVPSNSGDATVQETQQSAQDDTWATVSNSQVSGSTQGIGVRASKSLREILVREDSREHLALSVAGHRPRTVEDEHLLPQAQTADEPASARASKRGSSATIISPPPSKRRKILSPLRNTGRVQSLGSIDWDSQERRIHIYAKEGWKVEVHAIRSQQGDSS